MARFEWIVEERRNMEDNYVNRDYLEKTMYGIGYLENGELKHSVNGLSAQIYENMYAMEQNGIPVTPILMYTMPHTRDERPPQIMQKFRQYLKQVYNETYLHMILKLRQREHSHSLTAIQEVLQKTEQQYGPAAASTMLRYAHRWNIL